LASKKTIRKRIRQVEPNAGPKWVFGIVLRETRQGKGLSREQLAAAGDLDRSFISMVERGIQSPNIVVLLKIANVLKVPAAELIARTVVDLRLAPSK
jgi:transcriptional regulator with XRE-family HTH domain